MTPVDQRIINMNGYGDCMTACLASLLELPYEVVPQLRKIETEGGNWHQVFFGFLKENRCQYHGCFKPIYEYSQNEKPLQVCNWVDLWKVCEGVQGVYMAGGPSLRGAEGGHAVLVDGLGHLVHDPHPSRAGIPTIDCIYMIERSAA